MKPYTPSDNLVVRDCLDDDISDDVEDDVFIRDGRTCKTYEDKGLKRPLMPPRRKNNNKSSSPVPIMRQRTKCWTYCEPFCYGLAAITILIALIFLAALLLTMFPIPLQKIKVWLHRESPFSRKPGNYEKLIESSELIPCSQISVHKVWSKAITRMSSETPVRKYDMNKDGIDDIVIGYGIDDSNPNEDDVQPKCLMKQTNQAVLCEGGLLALNGATGDTLWQRWTTFTIFSLFCTTDINKDGTIDCVAAGRGGLIVAVDGLNGNILWELNEKLNLLNDNEVTAFIDLYTVNSIRDLDGDEIADILAVHVEETETNKAGHIRLLSGGSGKIIKTLSTPYQEEVFVPLQTITLPDGSEWLLIITGGQNTPGGIYSSRLYSILQSTNEQQFSTIFKSETSGFMTPAVLVDITGDSIEDIIISSFNSTVYAFNGHTYEQIWSYTFPSSESVSSIVPGHFNNDNVTDFMIKYNTGPGFPVYYYSQTTILSGDKGEPLLDSMMTDSGGSNSLLGGLSISQTFGGDFFLHWQIQCNGVANTKDSYQFIPDSDIVQQSRADTCMLRYNASSVLKLYAISRHIEPPGAVIFSTDDLILQLNQSANPQPIKSVAPIKHPKMMPQRNKESINNFNNNKNDLNDRKPNLNLEKKRLDLTNEIKNKKLGTNMPNSNNNLPKIISIEDNQNEKADELKPFIYLPYDAATAGREYVKPPDTMYDPDQQKPPDDYDVFYSDEQIRGVPMKNHQYTMNRDVRSKDNKIDYDYSTNMKINEQNSTKLDESETVKKVLDEEANRRGASLNDKGGHRETLWDLELEKETAEVINDNANFDYPARQLQGNSVQKRRQITNIIQEQEALNQNVLSSISSTGVLLSTIDKSLSSIDYVFVLNVRESEMYPPLFLPEDLACLENKMKSFGNYINDDMILIEKELLKKCLKERLINLTPTYPKYEGQIVVTRITISCSCGQLNKGEICSKLNTIDKQKWTSFMGNRGTGLYSN